MGCEIHLESLLYLIYQILLFGEKHLGTPLSRTQSFRFHQKPFLQRRMLLHVH